MPAKVKLVVARKDYPQFGIAAGDSHWVWTLWRGGRSQKHRSKVFPKPSQLETSEFLTAYYQLKERAGELLETGAHQSDIDDIVSDAEELRDSVQEKLDNMPEHLRDGDTGQLMQERIDELNGWVEKLKEVRSANLKSEEFDPNDSEEVRRAQLLADTL